MWQKLANDLYIRMLQGTPESCSLVEHFTLQRRLLSNLRVIYTDVCVVRARGKYLLGIMWPAEQAEVSARPIHHMQKTADTASTPWFPNALQQRGGPLQNPNHRYPTVSRRT